MAKTWYPVIDYMECTECGTCVKKCPHGVYDTDRAPSPAVINPAFCIDHCHGCGDLCPQGAITYIGDNTGWYPPHGDTSRKSDKAVSCCESSCSCKEECK